MLKVELIDRKGPALTSSALACLAAIPSLNLTAGCAHRCIYCYTRGYSAFPGESIVRVYRNTAAQVAQELHRKRRPPPAVYFSPSSDAFQPIPEVLDETYQTMRLLLEAGVAVQFVSKGIVPAAFIDLFARYPRLIAAQVGLCSVDQRTADLLEPHAASVQERLATLRRLRKIGAEVSLRADPLIHGLSDTEESLRLLLAAAHQAGVTQVAASYLFLRPVIRATLQRHLAQKDLRNLILAPYLASTSLSLRGSQSSTSPLPAPIRREGFARLRHIADELGMVINICGCKNGDLTDDRCHLTQVTFAAHQTAGHQSPAASPSLWPP